MTKKEMFNLIASLNADNTDIVEFCNHELELLANRKTTKTPTKTQKENEVLMELILKDLKEFENPITVSELILGGEGLENLSNQKVSALLRKLVDGGLVIKTIEKKRAYFSVA